MRDIGRDVPDSDKGAAAERPAVNKRYEVGVYRSVVHYATVTVEAESAEIAHEHVSGDLHEDLKPSIAFDWKHQRTELGVRFVKGRGGAK